MKVARTVLRGERASNRPDLPDQMKERTFAAEGYRYGFNGQEQDGELMDGAVVFKYRVHDPRIGKFLSVDPLSPKYPWNSSYAFAENRVIDGIDLEGAEHLNFMVANDKEYGRVFLKTTTEWTTDWKQYTIFGPITTKYPLSRAYVANYGFYHFIFATYEEMATFDYSSIDPHEPDITKYKNTLEYVEYSTGNIQSFLSALAGVVGHFSGSSALKGNKKPSVTKNTIKKTKTDASTGSETIGNGVRSNRFEDISDVVITEAKAGKMRTSVSVDNVAKANIIGERFVGKIDPSRTKTFSNGKPKEIYSADGKRRYRYPRTKTDGVAKGKVDANLEQLKPGVDPTYKPGEVNPWNNSDANATNTHLRVD
ncbi:MAG: RHS repeat-associated protein [Cognaticolwellia sp.]